MKIVIYGAFESGKYIASLLESKVEIVGYADSDEAKGKTGFEGYSVWNIQGLKNINFDKIVIAAKSYISIENDLKNAGLESLIYHDPKLEPACADYLDIELSTHLNLTTVKEYFEHTNHTASVKNGRFSFGRNWDHFVDTAINNNVIDKHINELSWWLEPVILKNKRVIDVGCGSGLSSWCINQLGCKELMAFDYDEYSVKATEKLFSKKSDESNNVIIQQGSILDNNFVTTLGKFDVVHSWGVLHHTGDMESAINNAISLCAEGGYLMIALYEHGPRYQEHLKLKKDYNDANDSDKSTMLFDYLVSRNFRYKFEFEKVNERGMNPLHDAIDWLGGYPYEVIKSIDVIQGFKSKCFELRKFKYKSEGGCSIYLFQNCFK